MTLTAEALNDVSTDLARDRAPHRWVWCGLLMLAGSVIGLASVQYLMPASFDNPPGVSYAGLNCLLHRVKLYRNGQDAPCQMPAPARRDDAH